MKEWAKMLFKGVRMFFQLGGNGKFNDIVLISGGRQMFLETLYRSMIAGGIILAILLLRLLLRRAPKVCSYLLWGIVLYRLLCPFTFVSACSWMGIFGEVDVGQRQAVEAEVTTEAQRDGAALENPLLQSEETMPGIVQGEQEIRLQGHIGVILWAAVHVWTAGIAVMLLYGAVSLFHLSRRLKGAVRLRDNIYLSDYVPTPFVIGVIRPRIYLPSSLQEKEMDYIILHERTHIRRGDHIVRLLSFFALAVYWFHLLVWAAYYLSGKDMEMSCDEAVMRRMERDVRADYSTSLLNLATGRFFPGGTPLAFGEGDTKARIHNVMRWRRPKPVLTGIALAVVMVAAVILGTDPQTSDVEAAEVENEELWRAANAWAKAVCDRDGNAIAELSTAQSREYLIAEELLSGGDGTYSFGWSSPWPWDSENGYRIVACTEEDTVILYYAWTSDPHVTVWQEHLAWVREGDAYRVDESAMDYLSSISDGERFEAAYGAGINSTPIDYRENGLGEALNEHALQNRESVYYRDLFAPETAAGFLLNLSTEEKGVRMDAGSRQEDGSVEVTISFPTAGGSASVRMIQPYGEDGIWIVQDAKHG